jgi:type III secretion protein L
MEEKIIKARLEADAGMVGEPKVIKKDVYEASLDARRIVSRAQREAETVLEEAVLRRDESLEAARREGYQHGLSQWDKALRSLEGAREALHARHEAELVGLAVKIAEKIIGEELRTRPETIVSIVGECLRGIRYGHSLTIRVNPSESAEVQRGLSRLQETIGPGRHIQVLADSTVSPGGCIVESDLGVIDARLETQLKRLDEILARIALRK